MITVDELKENILGLELGSEYLVYKKSKSGSKKADSLKGVFVGESGVNNEYYIFKSNNGYKECFLKIDFLINEYGIKDISRKQIREGWF
mgnify:CR=1 FL=1